MSDKHTLTTIFEISIKENRLLIDYHERHNTICEKIQYLIDRIPIDIDIEYLLKEFDSEEKRKEYIHGEIDCRILNQIANLLSYASCKMISEHTQDAQDD